MKSIVESIKSRLVSESIKKSYKMTFGEYVTWATGCDTSERGWEYEIEPEYVYIPDLGDEPDSKDVIKYIKKNLKTPVVVNFVQPAPFSDCIYDIEVRDKAGKIMVIGGADDLYDVDDEDDN